LFTPQLTKNLAIDLFGATAAAAQRDFAASKCALVSLPASAKRFAHDFPVQLKPGQL
jgi:hypothetical protein